MAINPPNGIKYGDLITLFKTWVKNNCNNVGSYSARVPACLKSGFSQSYTSGNKTCKFTIKEADVIPVIDEVNINRQIDNFFFDRNISQRKDYYVTTSGILNFWHNVAIFGNKRLCLVASQYCPTPVLMYNPNTVKEYALLENMTDMNTTQKESVVSANDFIKIAKCFNSGLADIAKSKYIIYAISVS